MKLSIILVALLVYSTAGQAQQPKEKPQKGNGKFIPEERIPADPWPERPKTEDEQRHEDQDTKDKPSKGDKPKKPKAEKSNSGNAYGRNKEVSGREFGQQRATEARSQKGNEAKREIEDKLIRHKKEISAADTTVVRMRQRIESAQQKIEGQRKAGAITEQEFRQYDERIRLASQKLKQLEDQVIQEKERAEVSRQKLSRIVEEASQ